MRLARPSVAVTGASGFLGRSVCKWLEEQADVLVAGRWANPAQPYAFRRMDLSQGEIDDGLLAGADSVVHCAGVAHVFKIDAAAEALMDRVNGEGAGLVARCAARNRVKRFVLVSSVAVYGGAAGSPADESAPCRPAGAYGESKLKGERLVREALAGTATSLSILRPVTVYGEGDRGNVVRLIRLIDSGRFFWIGRGSNRKSLIHADDAARGCAAAALDFEPRDGLWNLGGEADTMREIVECIERALGRKPSRLFVPESLARAGCAVLSLVGSRGRSVASTIGKWLSSDAFDCREFQRQFSFRPRVTLEEGIRREVEWYRTAAGGRAG
jgi:UDP-glucose 4-epimerase